MEKVIAYIRANEGRYLNELKEFLRIPSISSAAEHKQDMVRTADWLAGRMKEAGLGGARVMPTAGHPAVYGEWCRASDAPTLLVYGHYDVQPVDPLDLWKTPPFEPTVRGKDLFARGGADDKGQLYVHVKAAEAHLAVHGRLPVNLKFLIEGEEEIGSPSLVDFMKKNRDLLSANSVVVSDTPMYDYGKPSICYGLRGLAYLEVNVTGPQSDLHSGTYGGAVANPLEVLCRLVASLKDANGRITIPGFYDDVVRLTRKEREEFARLRLNDRAYARKLGVRELAGEKGFTTLERLWARPTLEMNGMGGGFQGEGAKTVLPSKAMAKISMRLVPHQKPEKIARLFTRHFQKIAPRTVRVEVKNLHGGNPAITPMDSPETQAAFRALEQAFGKKPVFTREGGSIPIVDDFRQILGAPTVLMGFGVPDENTHAPNEKFHLPNFYRGIQAAAHYFNELTR